MLTVEQRAQIEKALQERVRLGHPGELSLSDLRAQLRMLTGIARSHLNVAQAEQRGLTEVERLETDLLTGWIKFNREEIENRELLGQEDPPGRRCAPAVDPQSDSDDRSTTFSLTTDGRITDGLTQPRNADSLIFRDRNGREYRAVEPGESIFRSMGDYRLPDGIKREELDIGRAIRAMILGDWRDARAEQRIMQEGVDASGGYLVPSVLSGQLIDLARNKSRVMQAGARTIVMETKTLAIARVKTDLNATWHPEGELIPESNMAFDRVTLDSHTLVGYTYPTIELVEDARGSAERAIRTSLAAAIALEFDRCAFFGKGTAEHQPKGIWESIADGVQTIDMGTDGGPLTNYVPFSQAVEKIALVNGTAGAVILNPRDAGTLDRLTDTTGQPLEPLPSWKKLRSFDTNQIPADMTHGTATNASCAFVGDFHTVLWGIRMGFRLEISRVAAEAFTRGLVAVRAYMRGDVALARPPHLLMIRGIVPPT